MSSLPDGVFRRHGEVVLDRDRLLAENQRLKEALDAALSVLRDVEWQGEPPHGGDEACPYCGNARHEGHTKICRLAKAVPALEDK